MRDRPPIQLSLEQEQVLQENGLGQPLLHEKATTATFIVFLLCLLVTVTLAILLALTFLIHFLSTHFIWEELGFWRFLLSSELLVEVASDLWKQPLIPLIFGGLLLLELTGETITLAALLRLEVLVCSHGLLKQQGKLQEFLLWKDARALYTTHGQVTGVGGLEPEEKRSSQDQNGERSESKAEDEDEDGIFSWPLTEDLGRSLSWPLSFCTYELSNHIIHKMEEYLLPLMKERLGRGKPVAFLVGDKVLVVDQEGIRYEGEEPVFWAELGDLRLQRRGQLWLFRHGRWQRYPRRWSASQANLPLLVPLVRSILAERRQGG
ncbi:hypothetical protein [Thermogemmatispora carboxidivorans]|uniref:hypothetical protein n=1 Tax=Thermogemmatispora carboxidivorans TaxID=1382306 RepID=UPI0012DCE9CB|nr:hypothetical protein [Thermogemmatispora carboxidivorans]